jgi:hypothetical protein
MSIGIRAMNSPLTRKSSLKHYLRQCGGRIIDKTLKNSGAQSDEAPL